MVFSIISFLYKQEMFCQNLNMYKSTGVLLVLTAILLRVQAELPDFIKKCSRYDLNLGVCIAQNGNLALEKILQDFHNRPNASDGYNVGRISFQIDDNLEFNLNKVKSKAYGIRLNEQTYVDLEKGIILYFETDKIILNVDYNLTGIIDGGNVLEKGAAVLELVDLTYAWKPNMVLENRNNKQYYHANGAKGMLDVFKFEFNPFSKGENEKSLIQNYWEEIKSQLLKKFNNIGTNFVTGEVNKYLAQASIDEIFLH